MGLLDNHEPESWRFYVYGADEDGDPLFSFWMNIGSNTGVCIYERNQGAGKWLSTAHSDEEYQGRPPSDDLNDVLRDLTDPDGDGVSAERVDALPDHERYFVQVVHGTITQKDKASEELLRFLGDLLGTEVRVG